MENFNRKKICVFFIPILLLILSAYYSIQNIPTTIFVREGESIKINRLMEIEDKGIFGDKNVSVSLLGMLPVKSVSVRTVPEIMVYPGGQPVGVKLNTKGTLVVGLCDIEVENGKKSSPAANAGIEIGDIVTKVNGKTVNRCEEVASEINSCEGKEVNITIERKGQIIEKKLKPIRSINDKNYKIGLWIRDCTSGIGTLTFYDDKTKKFAALGHPITDVDTGTIMKVNNGEILLASIGSVRKGLKGNPGELRGSFIEEENSLGKIKKNTECGIFGDSNDRIVNSAVNKPLKIALRDEIKLGKAKIITTINGETPKMYDIEIEKLLPQEASGPKSMIIRITDKELLEKTGGIVQGMSGSPIIQDNKIVGAVTHVLINKPDTGYGIYIEWMLRDADILQK